MDSVILIDYPDVLDVSTLRAFRILVLRETDATIKAMKSIQSFGKAIDLPALKKLEEKSLKLNAKLAN